MENMKPDYARLLQAAKELKGWNSPAEICARLTEHEYEVSEQMFTNWKSRGVSKEGRLKASAIIGCRPHWIETGSGEMRDSQGTSTALGPAIQTPSVSTPVARLIQRLTEMEAAGQLTPPLLRALETLLEAVAPRRTSQKLLAAQALLSTQQILQGNSPHENPPPDPAQEHTPSAE